MKTRYFIALFALCLCQWSAAWQGLSSADLVEVKSTSSIKVEPAFWWCGMKNPQLQLMVYGDDIGAYKPVINYPGVVLKSVHPMESPNYLVLYLDVEEAMPGKFDIEFVKGKKKLNCSYELKQRQGNGDEKVGFNSSDVVYLLMPDRFANGDESNDQIKMNYPYAVNRKDVNARHGGDLRVLCNILLFVVWELLPSGQHPCWKMIWEKVLITVMPQLIIIK